MVTSWRLVRANTSTVDGDLIDGEIVDAFNRFARKATAILDDPDGEKPALYPRPTRVDLEIKPDGGSWTRHFGGFVVNPVRKRNETRLEIHSHDQWLRSAEVFRSFSSTLISTIIDTLVDDLTPLTIPGGGIDVVNDQQITRDWSGEPLDTVLDELASRSANEEFGATDGAEFFFRPRDVTQAARQFGQGQFVGAPDFEEDGKQAVNRITIYYGGTGGDAVRVDRADNQTDLQSALGLGEPVTIRAPSRSYPEITSEEAARAKGEQILNDRDAVQTGRGETWDAYEVSPGEVTRVTLPSQDIDGEYRIAETVMRWQGDDEVAFAENSAGVTDTLVAFSDDIRRIDNRSANTDATITVFEQLGIDAEIEHDILVQKIPVPDDQLLFGDFRGGLGDPGGAAGGRLGDQREDPITLIDE